MATQIWKDVAVWLAQYNIRTDLNQLEVAHGAEMVDDTVFGDATRSMMSGLETLAFTLNGFCDFADDAQDEIIRTRVGTQGIPITFGVETGLENTRAIFLEGGLTDYEKGGPVGVLAPFSLAGFASGGRKIANGLILEDAVTPRTLDGSGTERQLGTVTAAQSVYAVLHVVAYSGFTSVVIKVQSDLTGFGSPIDRVTFATVTGLTSEYAAPVAGPITPDDFWRVNWDVTGTGSISFVVVVAIK